MALGKDNKRLPDDGDHPEEDELLFNSKRSKETRFGDLIRLLLERNGRFQIIIIILLSLNSIIVGINHTITTFHVYVPEFFCRDNPTEHCYKTETGSNVTSCPSGYEFDLKDDYTVAVEFQTVCDRSMLAPLINSLYFVGVMIGSLLCSSLCDIYGRKKLVLLCLYSQALMALGQYYSDSLTLFITFRLLQGLFVQGLQTCSYTLAMEYCPSRYRTIAATYWEANWAIGLGILGALAYFIRNWRFLTLAVTALALISLTYSWLIPESIVWLKVKNRKPEAIIIIRKIARYNRDTELLEQCNALNLEMKPKNEQSEAYSTSTDKTKIVVDTTEKISISILLRNRVLRKHLLSMICVWFSVTLSYYGILFFLPNLAGQRHLNFEYGALIELLAYILAYFVLSRLGRRLPMAFYQYCNGILLLINALLASLPTDSNVNGWIVAITLIAKGLAVSSFCGMFIYCSELLPTVCRGLGLGLCGCAARMGSLLAPQLIAMMEILPVFKMAPLCIMSVLLLIAATVTLRLPETLTTILPNTITEADNIWS